MAKNRFECPQCGAKTELVYSSSGEKIIGIRCSKTHVYEKITATKTKKILKPNEVFFIEFDGEEVQLYRNNKLEVTIRDYSPMPNVFKEKYKESISTE